jgi:hyperosmotically inducible protein
MNFQAKILLFAAAAAALAVRPSRADELIISPLEAASVENAPATGRPNPVADSDSRIAARVKEIFVAQRNVVASDAEIDVKNGVVILSGIAVTEEHRAVATAYARAVDGVKSVDNRMTIAGTEVSVDSSALGKMDDAAVTVRVKAVLLINRSTSALKTKVETKDGVVTLRGRVRDAAQRDMIVKLVADLDGVAAVDNRLTIKL